MLSSLLRINSCNLSILCGVYVIPEPEQCTLFENILSTDGRDLLRTIRRSFVVKDTSYVTCHRQAALESDHPHPITVQLLMGDLGAHI